VKSASHLKMMPCYMLQVAREAWEARANTVTVFVVPGLTRILDQSVVVVPY